jgi:hypothetical protein
LKSGPTAHADSASSDNAAPAAFGRNEPKARKSAGIPARAD